MNGHTLWRVQRLVQCLEMIEALPEQMCECGCSWAIWQYIYTTSTIVVGEYSQKRGGRAARHKEATHWFSGGSFSVHTIPSTSFPALEIIQRTLRIIRKLGKKLHVRRVFQTELRMTPEVRLRHVQMPVTRQHSPLHNCSDTPTTLKSFPRT
jgi:hypothetical protein